MANETIAQFPTVTESLAADYVACSQGGVTVKETLQQIMNLTRAYIVLSNAGNPNGVVAGTTYQFCYDTSNNDLYICTTTGSTSTAVWTKEGDSLILPAQGGTGVASPTAHTLPVAEGSSAMTFLGPLTNGQLLIGSTGADPVPATITAGTNITVSGGAGSITISGSGHAGFGWNTVSGTSQAMAVNSGYIVTSGSLCTLTLPTTATVGSEIEIIGNGAGGWLVAQNSGQQILGTGIATTSGVGGSIASTNRYNIISLICTVTNTTWQLRGAIGGIVTVV